MGCASSSPLVQGGDLRPGDAADDSVATKVRQTVTGMADAVPVQDMIDGVTHVKDDALNKLHDLGETMKDKVESVVEDVEETIGSAFGTAKETASEAVEEAKEKLDSIEQNVEESTEKTMEEVEKEVDTMVEDLEETLPPPPRPESQANDFQMDVLEIRSGSQASTARLSRKSGDGDVEEKLDGSDNSNQQDTEEMNNDALSHGLQSADQSTSEQTKNNKEENIIERTASRESQQSFAASSTAVEADKTSDVSSTRDSDELGVKNYDEESIVPETDVATSAVPIERTDSHKETESEVDKTENKSPMFVELPAEKKEHIGSPGDGSRPGSEGVQYMPTPIPSPAGEASRPQSESERVASAASPQAQEPEQEGEASRQQDEAVLEASSASSPEQNTEQEDQASRPQDEASSASSPEQNTEQEDQAARPQDEASSASSPEQNTEQEDQASRPQDEASSGCSSPEKKTEQEDKVTRSQDEAALETSSASPQAQETEQEVKAQSESPRQDTTSPVIEVA